MVVQNYNSVLTRAVIVAALFVLATSALSFAAAPAAFTWTQLQPATAFPARADFSAAYDPVSKKVIAFGGYDANGQAYADTWIFDGNTWQQITTTTAPSARFGAAMAYDRKIRKLVLFGGASGFSLHNDTWLFDGATMQWTQAETQSAPPPAVHAMAFTDPHYGHADIYGGRGRQFYSRSTYRWTGTDWMVATTTGNIYDSPYPRAGGVSALDPVHKSVVIFGGISDDWVTGNTWSWEDQWTRQNPSNQPDTLYLTSGAFDPRLGQVVVFGGGSGGVDEDGTWTWNGSDWTLLAPLASPPAREQFGTIWDPATHQFLIFGGMNFDSGEFFGDTWELSGK